MSGTRSAWHRVAVLIPALDEEEALPGVLRALSTALPGARALVVDNGSRDRTAERARALGADVLAEPRRGYGTACQAGIARLQQGPRPPPEVLVILDADGADDPRVLPSLVEPILAGHWDFVLSTRTRGGGLEPGALRAVQRWGNRLQTAVLNRRFSLNLTDMGPMRAIRFDALLALSMSDPTWGWNVEMAARAARAGLRIREVPVPYRRRSAGRSKISGNLRGAARAGVRIVQALWRHAR
jgi:glycosyltransferase involved in cell wall biosynthesis